MASTRARRILLVQVLNQSDQVVEFLKESKDFVERVLRSGCEAYSREAQHASPNHVQLVEEKMVHITALFHRVFQCSKVQRDQKRDAKTVDQLLTPEHTEELTEMMQELMQILKPSSRGPGQSVLQLRSVLHLQHGGIAVAVRLLLAAVAERLCRASLFRAHCVRMLR